MVPKLSPVCVAQDLTVRYGNHLAVGAAGFELPAGTTALIGPNGSGKSSILQAITGMVAPVTGSLTVLGEAPRTGRADVAHVLQATEVNDALPVTVAEVVRMGRWPHLGILRRPSTSDVEVVEAAMDRLELTHLADRQLRDLSGGERQRAFVAQGLAQQAALLLLDEPLTGLDLPSQERIADAIAAEAAAGRSIVLTTHDVATAAEADHVVLLATHVVAAGTPAEVLTTEHLGHAYGGTVFRTPGGDVVLADPHVHGTQVTGHEHH